MNTHKRSGSQVLPAALIAAGLAATWLVPQGVAAMVGTTVETTGPNDTIGLAAGETTITLQAPEGWEFPLSASPTSATLTQGEKTLQFDVVTGVSDAAAASERKIAALQRDGIAAAMNGTQATGGAEFTGEHCQAVNAKEGQHGPCALVLSQDTLVTVVSLGAADQPAVDIQPLLDSLQIQEAK
ncbi:MAG TPA: hypothetical protein H9867_07610 [Candidatus Corynebacterium gallistercoris]|uniref:Uncharacterized protein n=1 Tax=Candidatus Corynebacterium gallistercoris TaxID=2838530 RepID=A0A9D1URS1_9CORY|nr:hypothetical protein [Candidatus Corynebacterium gallistercoris]